MAINLKKSILQKTAVSTSWTDFYVNMALEMGENVAIQQFSKFALGGVDDTALQQELINLNDNFWFAYNLTNEYDKLVTNAGKTLIGGVGLQSGNFSVMQSLLFTLLGKTESDINGDLLRDIGPSVQSYWLGARLKRFPPPTIPCIGAVQNISTTTAINLFPGVWTPIIVPPLFESVSPFLLNFIISANLHLLTISGLFVCNCAYPPPAPPAPGVLPYVGYFVPPLSSVNPLKSLDKSDFIGLAIATVTNTILPAVTEIVSENKKSSEAFSLESITARSSVSLGGGFISAKGVGDNEQLLTSDRLVELLRGSAEGEELASNLKNSIKSVREQIFDNKSRLQASIKDGQELTKSQIKQ
jgi:hypothetical protein